LALAGYDEIVERDEVAGRNPLTPSIDCLPRCARAAPRRPGARADREATRRRQDPRARGRHAAGPTPRPRPTPAVLPAGLV